MKLKRKMLFFNLLIGIVYSLTITISLVIMTVKGVYSHVENMAGADPMRSMEHPAHIVIPKEVGEFLILTCLYLNVRPRNWPQYFILEVSEN